MGLVPEEAAVAQPFQIVVTHSLFAFLLCNPPGTNSCCLRNQPSTTRCLTASEESAARFPAACIASGASKASVRA